MDISKSLELKEVYDEYRSKYCNKFMTSEQNEALKKLHVRDECQGSVGITLSQIDNLFEEKNLSKLLPKSVTGKKFINYGSFSIYFEEFQNFIRDLCEDENLDYELVQSMLLARSE